jgi:hypothetical protein
MACCGAVGVIVHRGPPWMILSIEYRGRREGSPRGRLRIFRAQITARSDGRNPRLPEDDAQGTQGAWGHGRWWSWPTTAPADQGALLALDASEGLLEAVLQGAGDEAVFGLAGIKLALRSAVLERRAFQREAPPGQPRVVLFGEFGDRAGRRGHAGRGRATSAALSL